MAPLLVPRYAVVVHAAAGLLPDSWQRAHKASRAELTAVTCGAAVGGVPTNVNSVGEEEFSCSGVLDRSYPRVDPGMARCVGGTKSLCCARFNFLVVDRWSVWPVRRSIWT